MTRYHKIAAILQTDNYAHFHHTIPKTSLPRPPYATSAALVRRHVPPGGLTPVNMREYTEDDMIAELRALGITNENIPEYRKHRLIDYFLTYKEEQMKKLEKAEEVIILDKKLFKQLSTSTSMDVGHTSELYSWTTGTLKAFFKER